MRLVAGKATVEWRRGPQPKAAGKVLSAEALVGVIEDLMNAVSNAIRQGVKHAHVAIVLENGVPDNPLHCRYILDAPLTYFQDR